MMRTNQRLFGKRFSRRRALGSAAVVTGAAPLMAACGTRGGSSSQAGQTSAGKPKAGGTLNYARQNDPFNFDMSTDLSPVQDQVTLTNDSLLVYKNGPDVPFTDAVIGPRLADTWETPDAQTYTFHLHPGVKFAELAPVNGRDMTSADVKWSFEYLSRTGALQKLPPAQSAPYYEGLDSVQTPDANTVVVRFSQPLAPFLSYAAIGETSILAHEIYDADGDFVKNNVGTGPWQLDTSSSQHGSRWVFKKNPTYWQNGLPYVDAINWLVLPDAATQRAAFQAKKLDILDYGTSGVRADEAAQTKKANPDITDFQFLNTADQILYINVTKPPLNDLRVRQAIALSVDRDAFVNALASGQGQWALVSSGPGLFTDGETKRLLKFDVAQAKQLLSAAGYPNGLEIEQLYYTDSEGADYQTRIQLFQSQMRQSGINITLKGQPQSSISMAFRAADYSLILAGYTFKGDSDVNLYRQYYSKSARDFMQVKDPKLDDLVVAQRREVDPTKRRDVVRQAIQYVNEQVYGVGFFWASVHNLWQPYVKGMYPNLATGLAIPWKTAWLAK
jgi:peptide/nickel transport system substrate-binding protein